MPKRTTFWTYENKIVTVFFLAVGFVFFDRLIVNFLMPFIQRDLHLDNSQIGLLAAGLSVTWAIASVVGGRISDRVTSKRVYLVVLMVAFSVASFLQGFAATFAHLFILRLLMGMLEGPVIPVTQSVLAMESSERRRGFNLGLTMNTANGLFGSILAPVVIVALATAFHWRTAFFLTVIPGLIMCFVIFKVMREPKAGPAPATATAVAPADRAPRPTGRLREVLKNRNIILSVVIFSGFMVYLMALQVFGPVFLTNVRGFTPGTMSLVMAAFGLGTAVWGFVVPLISDRIGRRPAAVFFGLLSIFAPLSLLSIDNPVLLALAVFVFAAGMGVGGLAMSVIPAESVPTAHAGLAVGLSAGVGELIGGFLNPMLTGAAADQYGLPVALVVSSAGALVATVFAVFLKETAPRVLAARREPALVTN
ncbi:MFS transporter [Georgenia ruanii]|uniref:MFS transporter n=1 Tax=Georgenia ruanii TaxID=348442 RepID=A0A7J9UY27_9MICO|nr:MFS transporter [Georgenia ruanii]MPV89537.1 MFS transporter [Georgenia ruanii]